MVSAARSNLKPVSLELGGKSPLLIFDDADVDKAAELALLGIVFNKVNFWPNTVFKCRVFFVCVSRIYFLLNTTI